MEKMKGANQGRTMAMSKRFATMQAGLRSLVSSPQPSRAMILFVAVISELPWWAWLAFFAFIVAMLAIDLGVFQRDAHEVKMKEALGWCGVWATLAVAFGALVWWWRGAEAGQQFLSAYLVELCLSMDNVFVFILIFAYFHVAARYQHRVLFWGIIGAVVMRAVFILVGVGVIARFHWVLYLFGAFLIYTGIKMALPSGEVEVHPERNKIVQLFRRVFPVAPAGDGKKFFTRHENRLKATPLFIVLLVVETSDVMFALDSIPAVLAITKDGFIALTSNIFAILGLRSLYFALSGVMQLFRFLKIGLAVILTFIGVKMLAEHWVAISTTVSLIVIAAVLLLSILASVAFPPKPDTRAR
jgi:tellurite resistance protein TerC